MKDPKLELVDVAALVANPRNPRTHSAKQIAQIASSLKAFGFINPVIIDNDSRIVAGHGRVLAAKSLGITRVPALNAGHLSPEKLRGYALADNRIAEGADWDESLLRIELTDLMEVDLDFSIDATGFELPEIDALVHGSQDTLDLALPPLPDPTEVVSRPGDIWQLGKHYIVCGDCREPALVSELLKNDRITMVLTDPPYNVKIDGHVSGLGATHHREFAMASGEMSREQFTEFLTQSIAPMAGACADGALIYLFMDWRHLTELQCATDVLGLTPVNLCVWVKINAGMGSLYRSQHELVWIVKKGDAPHINNVMLGKHGRNRSNVWNYAGMNAFGPGRKAALKWHPTVKPLAMIRDAILDSSRAGDWILDGFLGSGTTLLAAEQCDRRCLGIELDPAYVDVALTRWQQLTGKAPMHTIAKLPWNEIRSERLSGTVAKDLCHG